MNTYEHVQDFLSPIDPRMSIRKFGKFLIDKAKKDPAIAKKFHEILEKIGNEKPLIGQMHSTLYERIKTSAVALDLPTAPEWLQPIIVAAYLKAKAILQNGHINSSLYNDVSKKLDKVSHLIDKIVEPDFLGELLVETTLNAREDAIFAKSLKAGADEFLSLVKHLYELPDNPQEYTTVSMMRNNNNEGGCTACRTDPGGATVCTPISCWVIVIIIIVVIIAK